MFIPTRFLTRPNSPKLQENNMLKTTPKTRAINFNPFTLGIVLIVAVFIILLFITLINLLRTNPYGPEIKIDNLSSTYTNLPQDEQNLINAELYIIVTQNSPEGTELPTSGAIIRQDSANSEYDQSTMTYSGDFIVDIPLIKQSYRVQFEWSPSSNSQGLGGYPVVVSCLSNDKQIYEAPIICKDSFSDKTVNWQNEYQIDYSFGIVASAKIRAIIDNFLTSQITASIYNAILDETSLVRNKDFTDPTFSFKITLNDSIIYEVHARTDESYGDKYICVYIVDIENPHNYQAIIKTKTDESESLLSNWLQGIAKADTIEITYENLTN